jgi:hypothetical protein
MSTVVRNIVISPSSTTALISITWAPLVPQGLTGLPDCDPRGLREALV